MKYKCKCHPDSPFHWRDNPRPSIFAEDKSLRQSVMTSASQTMVVERDRLNGKDIGHLHGMTETINRLNLRQFTVFSRAVAK